MRKKVKPLYLTTFMKTALGYDQSPEALDKKSTKIEFFCVLICNTKLYLHTFKYTNVAWREGNFRKTQVNTFRKKYLSSLRPLKSSDEPKKIIFKKIIY